MITYKGNIVSQVKRDIKELERYKEAYNKRISLYNLYLNNTIENNNNERIIKTKCNIFDSQINKIDKHIEILNGFLNNEQQIESERIRKYNRKYFQIKNNYMKNLISEERNSLNFAQTIMNDYIKVINKINIKDTNENKMEKETEKYEGIKNNDTLLISEKLNKVILPYTAKEIIDILNDENKFFINADEVIEKVFTRDFDEFKYQFISRYNETLKLALQREKYGLTDSITLALEMMGKRFLHPAIISACRNLNELDVYLDCLDKNELDDFKIFKIKYELHPMIVKSDNNLLVKANIVSRIQKFIKGLFRRKTDSECPEK